MEISSELREKIITDMCSMIKCATISDQNDDLVNWDEYKKFHKLLKKSFPWKTGWPSLPETVDPIGGRQDAKIFYR